MTSSLSISNASASHRTRRMTMLVATIALAGYASLPVAALAQDGASHSPFTTGAVNLIGWEGAEQNSHGRLQLAGDGIEFVQDGTVHRIAWQDVRRFAIESTSRSLIRGAGGTLAGFAPQGAGQLYSAIRPGAQALSLLYADENQALHAAVIILPKDSRKGILAAFADAGLQPTNGMALAPQDVQPGKTAGNGGLISGRDEVRILFPQASTQTMPAAYAAELYEQTVAEVMKSGRFPAVWRDGDIRAGAFAATLTTTITHVRKGNAGARGALPVLGMFLGKTLIEADVRLADAGKNEIFNTRLKGSKSMPGESIGASKALAKSVSRSVQKITIADNSVR